MAYTVSGGMRVTPALDTHLPVRDPKKWAREFVARYQEFLANKKRARILKELYPRILVELFPHHHCSGCGEKFPHRGENTISWSKKRSCGCGKSNAIPSAIRYCRHCGEVAARWEEYLAKRMSEPRPPHIKTLLEQSLRNGFSATGVCSGCRNAAKEARQAVIDRVDEILAQ